MPVLVLAGDEEFLLGRRVKALKDDLLDPTWASVNFQRLENATLSAIIDASGQLPFGPGNKVILIDRCDLFTKKRSKGGASEESDEPKVTKKGKDKVDLLDLFEEAMGSVAPNTYLIFSCPHNFDSTLKTSKAVSKHCELIAFPKEKYWVGSPNPKLETWCQKEAKSFNATIDTNAVTYLLDGLESDLRQISEELRKAATYILPKTHITLETLEELTPFHSHVFVLTEKWISGRSAEAHVSLKELLSRQSGMPIIAMLQTMLSKWIEMKVLCDKFNDELPTGAGTQKRQLPLGELAKKVAAQTKQHPMVVEKDLKRIGKHSSASLMQKKIELTRLEDLVKTGQMPESHALEVLLTK